MTLVYTNSLKLPLNPFLESTVASIIPLFDTYFFILQEGLARFASKKDDFFFILTHAILSICRWPPAAGGCIRLHPK